MKGQSPNDRLLFRYLLGQVSQEERTQIEGRFIADEDFFRELLLAEDELRCAYAQGTLSSEERQQFEKQFLIFPDERKRVNFAKTMIDVLATDYVADESRLSNKSKTEGWKSLLEVLGFRPSMIGFAAATAVLLVLVGCGWLIVQTFSLRNQLSLARSEQSAREQEAEKRSAEEQARIDKLRAELEDERNTRSLLEQEIAEVRAPNPNAPNIQPAIMSLFLIPGAARGAGETKKAELGGNTTELKILLRLQQQDEYRSYQAELLNSNGEQVWSRQKLQTTNVRGAAFVVLKIAARQLSEDDYQINLRGLDATGQTERVADYYFTVLKKEVGNKK